MPTLRKVGFVMPMTAEQRRLRAQLGGHTSWANTTDRTARTAPARTAFERRFEKQVDPGGVLPAEQRAKMAESARKAYYARLSMQGAKARKAKAASRRKGGAVQ